MLVLAVLLIGYISFRKLGVDLFPDLNNPRIYVELKAGERPPEEIEKQFVDRIEALVIRQKKVIHVASVSRVGSAQITVEYAWDADMDEVFLDLQKALSSFSRAGDLDDATKAELQRYIATVNEQRQSTLMTARSWGESKADFALLNYNRRTGFDEILGTMLPYHF